MTQLDKQYLARIYNSFPDFTAELWRDRKLDQLAPLGDPELDALDYVANGPQKRGILAPRGIGKTTWGTATYTCWRLFRDPDTKIIVVSKSDSAARKMIKMIRGWISAVPFLTHLVPRQESRTRMWRDNTSMFDVGPSRDGKDPSVLAIGIEGQLENARAHVVIGDDVETKQNTRTLEAREDLDHRVREFVSVATYGKREIVYFGTPHHEESLYPKLVERGYGFRTWPLLYPQPEERVMSLAPMLRDRMDRGEAEPGDIVFDHRIDREYVAERQAEGRTYFAMQQMLVADLGDTLRYPLQLRDLIVFPVNRDKAPLTIQWGTTNNQGRGTRIEEIESLGFGTDGFYSPIMYDGEWGDYTGTKMRIDPAGRGADATGYAAVAHLAGYLWAKAVGGLEGGYSPEALHQLALIARQNNVGQIIVEDNFGQGMFVPLFEPVLQQYFLEPGADTNFPRGWRCSIDTARSRGQKEVRIIDALEPVMNQHRLVVDPKVAENPNLQRQLTRITRQRDCLEHDDEVEALAMCVQDWQDVLHADPARAAERIRTQKLDEMIAAQQRLAGVPNAGQVRYFQHR